MSDRAIAVAGRPTLRSIASSRSPPPPNAESPDVPGGGDIASARPDVRGRWMEVWTEDRVGKQAGLTASASTTGRVCLRGARDGGLLRVALRSEPVDAAAARQPFVDLDLALEPLDVSNVGAGTVRLDLPVIRLDALHLEDDSGRFCFGHAHNMG